MTLEKINSLFERDAVTLFRQSCGSKRRIKFRVASQFFLFLLSLIIVCYIPACFRAKQAITEDKALQICRDQLDSIGLNHDKMDIYIYPHPITRDSMNTGKGHIPFMSDSVWYERTREWIGNKAFWNCICRVESTKIGYCFIYIDSKSGEVLYVLDYGANAPKPWIPPYQKNK